MAKSDIGKQIIEENRQKKEEERLAKLPKEVEKPPSPKFKTVLKLRSTFPAKQTYSRKPAAYTGIGNDTYHTYDSFKVRIPDGPSKEELKQQADEEAEALAPRVETKRKNARFDPKVNKIRELERKVAAVLNDEKGKTTKKKPF